MSGYPITDCAQCGGRGWYYRTPHPDYPDDDTQQTSVYCVCEAGHRRSIQESLPPGYEVVSTRRTEVGLVITLRAPAVVDYVQIGFGFTL